MKSIKIFLYILPLLNLTKFHKKDNNLEMSCTDIQRKGVNLTWGTK